MEEEVIQTFVDILASQKDYIKKIENKIQEDKVSLETKLETFSLHDKIRDEYINTKVNEFLENIKSQKQEDKERIFEEIKNKVIDYFNEFEIDTKKMLEENLSSIQEIQKKSVKNTEEKIDELMNEKIHEYRTIHYATVNEAIKTLVARIPKPKNGEDGKVDYDIVNKTINEEVKKAQQLNKTVKDIEGVKEKNEIKVIYTDDSTKTIKFTKSNIVINSGGNSGATKKATVQTIEATSNVNVNNIVSFVNATENITVTLPDATINTGIATSLKRIDSTNKIVTINTTSSQKIDGNLTLKLTNYQNIQFVSDGANWYIL